MHQDGCTAKRRLDIRPFCVRAFVGIILGLQTCKSFGVSLFCSTTCIYFSQFLFQHLCGKAASCSSHCWLLLFRGLAGRVVVSVSMVRV